MNAPGRKTHHHEPPTWVDSEASDFFITICCQQRGTNQLCTPAVAPALLSSVRVYHEQRKWYPSLFLLIPDHLHMLVGFGHGHEMHKVIRAWKRYTANQFSIEWQREFFDHRLRSLENADNKAAYILQNPVRAGLMEEGATWPWMLMLD